MKITTSLWSNQLCWHFDKVHMRKTNTKIKCEGFDVKNNSYYITEITKHGSNVFTIWLWNHLNNLWFCFKTFSLFNDLRPIRSSTCVTATPTVTLLIGVKKITVTKWITGLSIWFDGCDDYDRRLRYVGIETKVLRLDFEIILQVLKFKIAFITCYYRGARKCLTAE